MFSIKITHQNDEESQKGLVTSPFDLGRGSPALKKKMSTSSSEGTRKLSFERPPLPASLYSPKTSRRYSSQTSEEASDGIYKPIGTVKPFQSSRKDSNISITDPLEKAPATDLTPKEVDNHHLSHQANMNTKKIAELQTLFEEARLRIQKLLRKPAFKSRDGEFDSVDSSQDKVISETIIEE